MNRMPFLSRPLLGNTRLLFAAAVLGLAAGCTTTAPPPASPVAVAPAPAWTFDAQSVALVPGVYQSAYSTRTQRLYATSAVGRPPVTESRLLRIDPATLRIDGEVTPPLQAGRADGQVNAVYGVAVDDVHGTVWTTATRSNSVAVYRQADLGLLTQFAAGAVPHARDVLIDEMRNRAYVSSPATPAIYVFDTTAMQPLPSIPLDGAGEAPKPMSLALDPVHQRLYTVSLNTGEVFAIDLMTGRQADRYSAGQVQGASGIAVDAQGERLYVASQKTGDVTALDARDGRVLWHVATGPGALNVAFDPVHRLIYVTNRNAGTVTVLDGTGAIQAQIATGAAPNHVTIDPQGTAWALVKSRQPGDPQGDRLVRIVPRPL